MRTRFHLPSCAIGIATLLIAPTLAQQTVAPSPQQITESMARLAVQFARDEVIPIPLDEDGSMRHGVAFDRFLLGQLAAHAAANSGAPIDAAKLAAESMPSEIFVAAYPLTCDGKANAPVAIELTTTAGPVTGPVRKIGELLKGAALTKRLAGFAVPADAIGQSFVSVGFAAQGVVAAIAYESAACPSSTTTVSLPFKATPGSAQTRGDSFVKLPDGSTLPSPTVVRVFALVDPEGTPRFPSAPGAPADLEMPAIAAIRPLQYSPFRVNGAPVIQMLGVTVTFTTDGLPPSRSGGPPPVGARPGGPPSGLATSVSGDRLTHETTSGDAAGLTIATSQCPVATDDAYGTAMNHPVQTGGGAAAGPRRELTYLNALRGPTGQGIHYRRLGSAMGPDRQTILDVYEITYTGLASAIRLYLDEYHFDEPKAPRGFACPAPIGLVK